MEIVLVLVVLLVIAGAAFVYMRGRPGGVAGQRDSAQAPSLRGPRGARVASRHDPMAVAVERHAQATDPHEAAIEEQNLQAQARSVAAQLHARQAQQPDPAAAQYEADPYGEQEPYVDPRVGPDAYPGQVPDPYAQPVSADYPAQPPAASGRPLDPDYPAQEYDPDTRPVDPDYPAQAPGDPYAPPPPPRKRRFF